jgi:hypothetical protein
VIRIFTGSNRGLLFLPDKTGSEGILQIEPHMSSGSEDKTEHCCHGSIGATCQALPVSGSVSAG